MLIERLKGQICLALSTGVVIDVNGVGYRVELPLSLICELPQVGSEIELWTYTYVREDALRLYGFKDYVDRVAFELLLSLSGVGPKLALAILSTLSVDAIRAAVLQSRADVLEVVPGIGKRLAEKILLDFAPKVNRLAAAEDQMGVHSRAAGSGKGNHATELLRGSYILDDVRSALENLGFKEKVISSISKDLAKDAENCTFQELMRKALVSLGAMPQREDAKVVAPVGMAMDLRDTVDSKLF